MRIFFYGHLAEAIGRAVELDVPADGTVAELRGMLAERFPHAAASLRGGGVRACIADRVVPDESAVPAGATVEFFPPLSGG